MKTINVVAAVICNDLKDKKQILATARGYGEFKGMWEFPGGKVELNEDLESALKREIFEELKAQVRVGHLIDTIEYDYPNFHLSMKCFWCEFDNCSFELLEHLDAKWLTKDTIERVNWLPAIWI